MRYQIVKETFADEQSHFYIKKKELFFWSTVTDFYDCTDYFDTIEEAMVKLQSLIKSELSRTIVNIEVVYDTGK